MSHAYTFHTYNDYYNTALMYIDVYKRQEHSHVFHQRVANYTGIKIEHNEMTLLNKGLMYNIPSFYKNFMIREIICAEAAIKTIDNISHRRKRVPS